MRKKLLSIVITMCLAMSLSTTAFAATTSSMSPSSKLVFDLSNQDLNSLSTENLNKFKQQVNSLSDSDFDSFIVGYLTKEKDFSKIKNNLSKLGVELQEPKKGNDQSFSIQSFEAWNLELEMAIAKRASDSYYRMITVLYTRYE